MFFSIEGEMKLKITERGHSFPGDSHSDYIGNTIALLCKKMKIDYETTLNNALNGYLESIEKPARKT